MKNIFILISLFSLLSISIHAQIKFSEDFFQKMEAMQMEFLQPLEASYKKIKVKKNLILKYDSAIKAKKEDMEIRFALKPESVPNQFPHMQATSMTVSIATNEQDTKMVMHEMSKKDLEEYDADWGLTAFFSPKDMFSEKKHCKMISLYKEGEGMAYVFFLFDKPSEEVDMQKYCLKYATEVK